ncbi:unnamed protein product [Parnassius apollo]|uniref:(apollo) hypothetical protein n=1 Tax=Parnassius apollo TaxID=110799 RepID=A0A8S3W8E1_PARAO|nr:unnamed protein product [Parnassius apollo]
MGGSILKYKLSNVSATHIMWNPRNNPVPQVFIDVLLDEEEAEEVVIDEEVGEQDDWDVSSMPICYVRSDRSWGDLSELLVEPAEVSGSPAPAPVAAPVAAPEAVPGPAPRIVEGSPAPAPVAAPVAAPEAVPGPAPRRVEAAMALLYLVAVLGPLRIPLVAPMIYRASSDHSERDGFD